MIRAFLCWGFTALSLFLSNAYLVEIITDYICMIAVQNSSARGCSFLGMRNFVKKNVYAYFITSPFGN